MVTAIDNIFARCLKQSHIAHHAEAHPTKQLDVCANFVTDLGAILKQARAKSSGGGS